MSSNENRLSGVRLMILILRVTMEGGIVAALAYWGAHAPGSTGASVALAIAAPVLGFGIWGAIDFRRAGRYAEPLRLAQELVISLGAAAALYATGQHSLGVALGSLSIAYHALVYATGATLLGREVTAT